MKKSVKQSLGRRFKDKLGSVGDFDESEGRMTHFEKFALKHGGSVKFGGPPQKMTFDIE